MAEADVRPAAEGDLPRLAGIEAAADRLLVDMLGAELFTEVTTGADRAATSGFLLVTGRPCVGFAHVLEEGGPAHLQQLAVEPAAGRRGLGTALVHACCERARRGGHDALTLTTFRDVPFNAPWYARLGFVVVDHPVGTLAEHLRQESAYAALSPRVAMRRAL